MCFPAGERGRKTEWSYETMINFSNFVKKSSFLVHRMNYNSIRQFLIVTFNEIFCKLALFLFYGTPAKYIASGNSWWLLWPKCWLETKFDCRFRLRFSWLIQLILCKCVKAFQVTWLTARVKPAESLELGTLFARTMLCPTDSSKISK